MCWVYSYLVKRNRSKHRRRLGVYQGKVGASLECEQQLGYQRSDLYRRMHTFFVSLVLFAF